VPGLIFLKYISDTIEEQFEKPRIVKGDHVGLPDNENNFDFNECFTQLKAKFEAQLQEDAKLNALIAENLGRVNL